MKKILTVIGARPQIIKAAAISREIRNSFSSRLSEVIVHTGQHYDENMSEVFFRELGIPKPDYNLGVGSTSHSIQTARMMEGIEKVLVDEKPVCTLLYGDTNSTLAGAIASAKIHIPVVHVEAGLRSFNKNMPEEINRIVCDHASTLLFSPTVQGIRNLEREGFASESRSPFSIDNPKIFHCGDVMLDNTLYFSNVAKQKESLLADLGIDKTDFALVTIHRDNNTDNSERLSSIFKALIEISVGNGMKIILPIHPRTRKMMAAILQADLLNEIYHNENLKIIPPVSFLEMTLLESRAHVIVTDSGGVQKEAFFFQKPCVILRPETEWVELVQNGNAVIADADYEKIVSGFQALSAKKDFTWPPLFGDGRAAHFICSTILEHIA